MAIDAVVTLGRVLDAIEQRGVVAGPGDGADLLGGIGQKLAGAQIFNVQTI